jgi:CBS domain-containing protein
MTDKQTDNPVSHKTRPLVSLNAVAFDSETTGLDTSKARIIQLGAVRIHHGQIIEDDNFQQLVNPAEAIPEASSKIHHIYDQDVADAENFTTVNTNFNDWRGNAVLIGYASGFDLAMLKREHQLGGLDWQAPRTLDVRYLVNILAPNLPDFSLDTIAGWLGVEIKHRHSALGDAIATAQIFIALIPLLRERDVRTLAEAERACLQFSQSATDEVSLGWHELDQPADSSMAALAKIDSYPYRHRLRDLMSQPALFVDAGQSLSDVLKIIIENRSSAVFVKADSNQADNGIVTERDLLRTINAHGKDAFEISVGEIAQYPLLSLSADAFVYRAISRMQRLSFRHLGVHNANGEIVGALSARDLLRQRADYALILGDDIDHAESAEAMAAVWSHIAQVASSLAVEGVDARDIAAVVSRELCALTRQACKIAEQQMLEENLGTPPCRYAMLVLGSGGRGESLLAMDQDNAIVFEQGEIDGEEDRWFAELGKRVADILHIAGVPYCQGNIMASNADWRQSEAQWRITIGTWIKRQTPDDILNCDIFFDSVCVHGDTLLADKVLNCAFEVGASSATFIKLMSVNACKNRTPLGMFGRFQLDDGRMDLKIGGIMSLFSCARILAIKNHCRELATPKRFQAVAELQDSMQTTFENLIEAHRIIFNSILQQQLLDLEKGIPLSNNVAPGQLQAAQRKQLKWALEQVPNVSNLLGDPLSSL